jgi:hypothetical protein
MITILDPAGKFPVSIAEPAAVFAGELLPTMTPASTMKVSITAHAGEPASVYRFIF